MKTKIIWKLLGAYILLIFIAVFILNFFVGLKLKDYYEQKISEQLFSNAQLVGKIIGPLLLEREATASQAAAKQLATELNSRITVIDKDGRVLGDSQTDPELMENHNERLEIIRARQTGRGESNRFSDTLGYNMKYVALPIIKREQLIGFVRMALPLTEIETQLRFIYRIVLAGGIITIIFVLIIGYFISRSIVNPIREIQEVAQRVSRADFSKRVSVTSQDELGLLARSINTMADELKLKIDHLKEIDKLKSDFVANVSHELKTPLTSIKGFIETLEDGAINDQATALRFMGIIKKHTERLNNIINDLLSLGELETENNQLEKTKFSLTDLIKEVALGFGHALSVRKQSLTMDIPAGNFTINADKAKIEQLLVNLIDNAIKYTPAEGTITISLVNQHPSLAINIQDSGIGIPAEHLGRIFERFYRVDKARSRQFGGTGLGLAIVKHIVSLHQGTIQIESKLTLGTLIKITLPIN